MLAILLLLLLSIQDQAARHKAVIEPLIAQREHEVAWWKSELEAERTTLLTQADARCEALSAEWAERCDATRVRPTTSAPLSRQ